MGGQKASSAKDKFSRWFKNKKKSPSEKNVGPPRKSKGKGKGKDQGKDKGKSGKGKGKGKVGESERTPHASRPSLNLTPDDMGKAGVSDGLIHKLMATKQRLLAGNAEAARAGAARAEPGAWMAANAEKNARKKGDGKGKTGKKGKDGKESQFVPVVREELVALNRQIASHAQARDLAAARSVLQTLESKGWANGHTYAAAVHALCRCGDWRSAEEALARAEKAGLFNRGAGAASGLITRTSMIRGYVECARDLGKARELLERMEKEKVLASKPNVRTANTFLRGCLILGSVNDAETLLERMTTVWAAQEDWYKTHGGKPDASTYELVVSLLCQALRYTDARQVALQGIKELGASPGSAAMFASIARAAIICGNEDAAALNLKRARKILSQEADFSEAKLSSVAGSGGKRGTQKWNRDEEKDASVADRKAARARSLEVFQSHRQREILSDIKEVEEFMAKHQVPSESSKKRKKAEVAKNPLHAGIDLENLYMRTLCFEDYGDSEESDSSSLAAQMCRRLCQKFGLESDGPMAQTVLQHFCTVLEPPKKKRKRDDQKKPPSGSPRLDLRRLFASSVAKSSESPLHLEICSGSGEWLSSQALRDPNTNWMACELRFDRSARCFQRFALRELTQAANVGIIVGDAQNALENHLKKGCCSKIFINHPEPPHQTDLDKAVELDTSGETGTEATHLLTLHFLQNSCAAVLQDEGLLTICTDNLGYGEWLLNAFASEPLSKLFQDALKGKAGKAGRISGPKSGVSLRNEAPPVEICGAVYRTKGGAGGSYFQRLKESEKGSRGDGAAEERYYLCLKKRSRLSGEAS